MAILKDLSAYVIESIKTPLLEADPVYLQLVTPDVATLLTGVDRIITQTCSSQGYAFEKQADGNTLIKIPTDEESSVILLIKKEIYFRLATSLAADWNVETEFTKLLKGDRFTHYMKLLSFIQKEIDQLIKLGQFIGGSVMVGEVVIDGRDGTLRNYNLSKAQEITMRVGNITQSNVELDWTLFDTQISRFLYYDLFISTKAMYDPYAVPDFDINKAENQVRFTDIRRTKYRFTSLLPDTDYYIVLIYYGANGRADIASAIFHTLA